MSSTWGNKLKLSMFGESHGRGIGVVIDGLPSGIKIDFDYINKEMKRRSPGNSELSTPRKEKDSVEILSGYFNERTTGTPLCAVIFNENTKSTDYDMLKDCMRPSHGDYTGYLKYNGFNDYRGGGHFSGRLTAPMVFAGAIAMEILEQYYGIIIGSHIKTIYNIEETEKSLIDINRVFHGRESAKELLLELRNSAFPVLNNSKGQAMKNEILKAKEQGDSVGGIIETAVINICPALGEPLFDSMESRLSQILFSIPAVKGVQFGKGFDIAKLRGSDANDEFIMENSKVKTISNNNGGILGGITNGMPMVFSVAIKPTPSISKVQKTINISTMENTEISVQGRHDPCIVPRAIPVIESATALTILDFILEREGKVSWQNKI